MTIDTLAYTKVLEKAGVDRSVAEAHVEAMVQQIFPQIFTKLDGERLEHSLTLKLFGGLIGVAALSLTVARFLFG